MGNNGGVAVTGERDSFMSPFVRKEREGRKLGGVAMDIKRRASAPRADVFSRRMASSFDM